MNQEVLDLILQEVKLSREEIKRNREESSQELKDIKKELNAIKEILQSNKFDIDYIVEKHTKTDMKVIDSKR